MKPLRPLLLLSVLLGGCSVFEVPRSEPADQPTPWAAEAVREARKADREQIERALEKERAANPR